MSKAYQPQTKLTTENIIRNYQLLSSQDADEREGANRFLMGLADHEETWITCQNMIQMSSDPNFIYLGAQLLYQKIQRELHQLDSNFKLQLKNFIFSELDSGKHTKKFVIDKLASSGALIASTLFLDEWPSLVQDLTEFMKKSSNHLLSGLIVLERIPEELRMTNRIQQGVKSKIQEQFLAKESSFAVIFDSVFELNDENCVQAMLKTIESWIRVCFPLMKYPTLVAKVLQNSLQNVQKLQIGMKVIVEAVKLVSEQKSPGLSSIDPTKQHQYYAQQQITSLKSIIQFAVSNKSNFLSYVAIEPEYTEMYLQLIQQLLLSFGFLLLENIGFELLQIIQEMTRSKDLKLSYSTFEFWTDFSERSARIKLTPEVKEKVWSVFVNLLDLFAQKLLIVNMNLMVEADLKDDDTVDDADGMNFTDYRKQASSLLRSIYDYFVKVNKEQGGEIYFKKVCFLMENDNPPLSRYTQLALFMLKSPLQSMINPSETSNIVTILQYLITKINSNNSLTNQIPPIVLGETMNFIRDCTREIKEKDQLFLEALKFVLNYINDQKLCHHAAYCFQILMQTINTLNDSMIAESLIQFYSQKKFTKQVVLEKMLEGIFNAIIKVPQPEKVQAYLDSILNTLFTKYQSCSKIINLEQQSRSELYLSLVQIKTVMDSYDSSNSSFKQLYKVKFMILANKAVEIVNEILPLGIKSRLKFSSINQVGLAISIYRVSLKILEVPQNFTITITPQQQQVPTYILSLDIILMILNQQDICEYYYTLTILSETLIQFINHMTPHLNLWLSNNLPFISSFFLSYYQNAQKVDPDIIKMFFTVQESLILYNRDLFNQFNEKELILNVGLHALKNHNERNMQRKIVAFINLSLDNLIYANNSFQSICENVFASIPIIHSMCYTNLSKIFKHLFNNTTLESKQKIFSALLTLSPYNELDQTLRTLLSKAISMALMTEEERNIKSIFMQLSQIVWKKISSDIVMQLQLKIANWKREYKKLQSQKITV